MRTGGMTMPSSAAIWRRIAPTRREQRAARRRWSTSGTRPKPIASSSGSSASASSAASRGAGSCGAARRPRCGGLASAPPRRRARSLAQRPADARRAARRRSEERDLRQPRDEREGADHPAGDHRRLALGEDLGGDVVAEVAFGGRAGDQDARRDRDQQRRDLRREPVADGQQREVLDGLAERACPAGSRRSTMPPSRLISDDQDARDRVALDELRGAVHRAVEVGFAGDLVAPACGLARR